MSESLWYNKEMSVVISCLALALAVSVGACGRIGFESRLETDAGPSETDGGLVGDGGSLQCVGEIVSNCAGTTLGVSTEGTSTVRMDLKDHAIALNSTCGNGPVAEGRVRILTPATPAIVTVEVTSEIDIMLSIIADDCDGASQSCTTISANSNRSVQIATEPDEVYIISAASNTSCGNVEITIRGGAKAK